MIKDKTGEDSKTTAPVASAKKEKTSKEDPKTDTPAPKEEVKLKTQPKAAKVKEEVKPVSKPKKTTKKEK